MFHENLSTSIWVGLNIFYFITHWKWIEQVITAARKFCGLNDQNSLAKEQTITLFCITILVGVNKRLYLWCLRCSYPSKNFNQTGLCHWVETATLETCKTKVPCFSKYSKPVFLRWTNKAFKPIQCNNSEGPLICWTWYHNSSLIPNTGSYRFDTLVEKWNRRTSKRSNEQNCLLQWYLQHIPYIGNLHFFLQVFRKQLSL